MGEAVKKTETKESILSINNIEVVYDEVILVLRGISLEVPKGDLALVRGPAQPLKTVAVRGLDADTVGRRLYGETP